jgi:hypothetical protein
MKKETQYAVILSISLVAMFSSVAFAQYYKMDPSAMFKILNTTSHVLLFVNGGTGYVGIGIGVPNQTLEINGGMRLNTTLTKPTCSDGQRGTFWYNQSAAGDTDIIFACMKSAADAYAWKEVANGG